MQKILLLIALFSITSVLHAVDGEKSEQACYAFINEGHDNYKHAHKNLDCLSAAEAGKPGALYAVGMGFGFDEDPKKEMAYYREAANGRSIAAYLALGHTLSENPDTYYEAIYWYQRYVFAKPQPEAVGYAAIRISQVFEAMGNSMQAEYWKELSGSWSKDTE